MAIRTVSLLGASGELGSVILDALIADGSYQVTVLQRASSRSKITHNKTTKILHFDDDFSVDQLTGLLKEQDAVIAAFRPSDVNQQMRLAEAAAEAGVKRFIPADFGSCDSGSARAQELVPLFKRKTQVRERLQELAESHPNFTWTSLVCGHFFDWGLRENFLHFNIPKRKAEILDDGTTKSSQSTLARIAEATIRVFQREEITRNRVLFIQSFCVSQGKVLKALERVTDSHWSVGYFDSEQFIKENKAKADEGDKDAVEDLVFALGAIDGNWETRDGFAMKELGLEDEDLEAAVRKAIM